jgi:hypothetical protein
MARVRYSLDQRVFIYEVKKRFYKSCKRKYHLKLSDTTFLSISKLVKKVRTHGILINRKPLKRNRVLTEGELDDIDHRLENSPRKLLRRLTLQRVVSVGSAWTATELLHIHLYIITVVSEIKPWIMKEELGFVIGLSILCMTDFLILGLHYSQMRPILTSLDMITHSTTCTPIVKIIMP